MLIDSRQLQKDLATQVCVVGAGPAGLALAVHLLRNGIETTLLAGGGEDPDSEHQQLARVVSRGIPTDDAMRGNIRALGGTSLVWGGYCLRMAPEDFELRPWIPHSGWPISFSEVDSYYAKAAALLGGEASESGPWSFDPEQYSRGKLLRNPILKNAVTHVRPVRLGRRHRDELRSSAAMVCLYASAVDLETDAAASHVTAVRCRTLAGNTFRVRARLVIVAAGALQNARLLLLSRSANPAGIGNGHDVVGRYFMQHPEHRHGSLLTTDFPALLRLDPGANAPNVTLPAAFTRAHQQKHSLPSCHFLLSRADYYTLGADEAYWAQLRRRLSRWKRLYGRTDAQQATPRWVSWLHRGDSSVSATSLVQIFLRPEQVPNPESRVSLSEELDALGVPLARMDWRLSEQDWEYADQCLSWFGCAVGGEGIGRVQFQRGAAREAARSFLHGGFHYYGTTRMSDDPRRGVVDRNCRVHGVENLYMAGSSVFPTSGYANPTFTIVALALRLAEHVKSRMR